MKLQRFYKKVKLFRLTYFLLKNTKYKTVQPLCGMDLQRFYEKAKLFKLIYFLVKNTEYKGIQLLCGMDLQSFNNSSLPTVALI